MRVIYKLNDDICVGKTYIENDTSVLFDSEALRTEELGFTLSLGDNLRFMRTTFLYDLFFARYEDKAHTSGKY